MSTCADLHVQGWIGMNVNIARWAILLSIMICWCKQIVTCIKSGENIFGQKMSALIDKCKANVGF